MTKATDSDSKVRNGVTDRRH